MCESSAEAIASYERLFVEAVAARVRRQEEAYRRMAARLTSIAQAEPGLWMLFPTELEIGVDVQGLPWRGYVPA